MGVYGAHTRLRLYAYVSCLLFRRFRQTVLRSREERHFPAGGLTERLQIPRIQICRMEALSQSPSSNTRSKSRVSFVGDKDKDKASVLAKKLEESRLKARERQRRKRERDRSEMESSQKKLKVSFEEGEESTQPPAEEKTNEKDTTLSTADEKRRLKARERQRRKRERDRSRRGISLPNSTTIVNVPVTDVGCALSPPDKEIMEITSHLPDIISVANPHGSIANPSTSNDPTRQEPLSSIMTPNELAKREKNRQAARDRQRKHRALVKAKRMAAETGLSITTMEGPEQPTANQQEDEHHEPIIEDTITHPHIHATPPQEPSFPIPQSHITLGQTFAQIMLLSVSYTPMLKRDLLRTLHMSEEDLNSLMPMIASVWDQWSYDRSLYHTANAPESVSGDNNAASTSSNIPPSPNTNPVNPDQYSTTLDQDQDQNEDADQFQEPYDLSSADFTETPLVSVIYHLKNRLSQLFKRENRRFSFNRSR
ncbi:hypothetical protein Clacol_008012 [Clathrus columnatus]|uniref:BZIP domain-containing protein n=1 Tax=Clathrus columnatus TaxID=1419009 RepID=A0AAV5AGJ4_9AGAM|nr:hypothetical protein Clacol_008012 [Clathrus columnatus]